jgi:hypothetical protein
MSERTIRRAAERHAAKQAAKLAKAGIQSQTTTTPAAEQPLTATASSGATFGFPTEPESAPIPGQNQPISDAKLAANRANAKLSTGPSSAEGRAKSSMNAVKTGLTSRSVLLSSDDVPAYQQHLDRHVKQFAPTNDQEKSLVHSIADTEWRLLRIVPLEASIWAVARIKLAELYPDISDPITRQSLIDGEIQLAYRKDLSNLALQERRLRNQSAADTAKLDQLRADARKKRATDFDQGFAMYVAAKKRNHPFNPAFFGFVFSVEEMEHHINRLEAIRFIKGSPSELTEDQFVTLMTQKAA